MRITAILAILLILGAGRPAVAGALPETVKIEFENNQVYVAVAINRGPPRWFMLDSGASGCIVDATLAKTLGLAIHGEAQGTGAGQGTYQVRFVDDISYAVGTQDFTAARSYVIDLSGQRTLMGRDVAGVLGYEFFERYIVRLDFDARTIELFTPETSLDPNGAAPLPFKLARKTPHIDAEIAITAGRADTHDYLVDSGSGDAIADDAISLAPDRVEIVSGVGLGQEFRSTLGRAASFTLAGMKLTRPVVGAGGVRLIGNEILRRFVVTFDYPHAQLWLKPNSHLAEHFQFDASGLDLRWTDDLTNLRIHDVAQASPAAEAGLRSGDVITTVNARPAKSHRMEEVLTLLRQAGSTVHLNILREGATQHVTLKLRARI